jgi:hypothetical protein
MCDGVDLDLVVFPVGQLVEGVVGRRHVGNDSPLARRTGLVFAGIVRTISDEEKFKDY